MGGDHSRSPWWAQRDGERRETETEIEIEIEFGGEAENSELETEN
jgi:hypothetical protein